MAAEEAPNAGSNPAVPLTILEKEEIKDGNWNL